MAVNLMWYVRRLQRMKPAEMLDRATTAATQRRWRSRLSHPPIPPVGPRSAPTALPRGWNEAVSPADAERVVGTADELMKGTVRWLGETRNDLVDPNWHIDGAGGPQVSDGYAFDLPLRDPQRVGSIKLLWEPNRLQHLTVLAAAYSLTADVRYAERAGEHLRSWLRANPFMAGPNWTSGIELGIRLISLAWTRRLLDGWDGASNHFENNDDFAGSVIGHGEWLETFESKGSSANNHVLAEAAGLVVAGYAFDWAPKSAEWRRSGTDLLAQELRKQTFPSGVNRELASAYDGFVFELVAAAALEISRAGDTIPADVSDVVVSMADVHAAMVDSKLHTARQGDGDNGLGVLLDDWDHSLTGASRLSLCASVVEPLSWWPSSSPDVRSAAFGSVFEQRLGSGKATRPETRPDVFSDAGMVIFRGQLGSGSSELWCRFDAGEFAFLSIGSHAHADQLSIELRHDGVDIIADPGTYTYVPTAEDRTSYRSTMAHATVEIDGQDQAQAGGAFLWLSHPQTHLEEVTWKPGSRLGRATAHHDGYAPSTHRRTVAVDLDAQTVTLTDTVTAARGRSVVLRFPLGPTVSATIDGGTAKLNWADEPTGSPRHATVELDTRMEWTVATESPDALGSYAPEFGTKCKASTIVGRITGSDERLVTTTTMRFES